MQKIKEQAEIAQLQVGARSDQAAAELFPDFSRGQLQKWIKSGELKLDGQQVKPKTIVRVGQLMVISAELKEVTEWQPEAIELVVLFEDDDVIVIDKQAGIVVHPAAGNPQGTLANAILAQWPDNQALPRAGIVHRLDKDTSGLMVVAKSLRAHKSLVDQLQNRTVKRQYRAVACGEIIAGGTVEQPIGRHPTQRVRMSVRPASDPSAKPAVTHFRIRNKYQSFTEVDVSLETGRTHQIRVHMAHLGFPLLGDPVYRGSYRRPAGISEQQNDVISGFKRQALHAANLAFVHPEGDRSVSFASEVPDDYQAVVSAIAGSKTD